jgi:hypothetical protein
MQHVAPCDQLLDPIGEAPLDIGESSGELLGVGVEQGPISASGTLAAARVRAWTSHPGRSIRSICSRSCRVVVGRSARPVLVPRTVFIVTPANAA